MKKTLLAVAVLTSFISSAANAADVYEKDGTKLSVGGRAEVRGLFSDSVEGTMEDKSRARINFAGETKISENLTGFGFMEYEIKPDSDLKNRYLYAGFGTVVGDFSYGKQDTANVQISDMTDIASYHSGQQQHIDASSDKQSNNFVYAGSFLNDALSVQANYIASDEKDADSAALSALYAFDFGLDLGVSYTDEGEKKQVTAGAAYTLNSLYLGATYAAGEEAENDDFTSLELAAQYKFTTEFRLLAIYGMAEQDKAGAKTDTQDFAALEAQYRFNKSIRTYVSYKLDNLDGGEDELLAGLRYSF
ncbi:porin [Psychromonas ossibalaenae]|uniref:porin n=1 Tax=Psychromonas ossibalaenae TaxID=444922 RepID=UPI00035EFD09|nr:porin [Psychromonas ossibalaenae]